VAIEKPSARRLAKPKVKTMLGASPAPKAPATTAKVVMMPSSAAKTKSLKNEALSWMVLLSTPFYSNTKILIDLKTGKSIMSYRGCV